MAATRCWFGLVCLLPGLAMAGGEAYQAVQLYRDLEYAQALEAADAALRLPIQEPAELVSVYRIQGLCLSALGKTELALDAFQRLLSIDPSFRLSQDVSPKLAAPFFQALAMIREQEGILVTHTEPREAQVLAGRVLKVTLEADPVSMVSKIRMRFKLDQDQREKQMVASVAGPRTVAMKLPASLNAREIRYYFEALNQQGAVLHRLGSRSRPLVIKTLGPKPAPVLAQAPLKRPEPAAAAFRIPNQRQQTDREAKPDRDWYQTWWFWSAVVATAAGITTAAILATGSDIDQPVDYGVRIR